MADGETHQLAQGFAPWRKVRVPVALSARTVASVQQPALFGPGEIDHLAALRDDLEQVMTFDEFTAEIGLLLRAEQHDGQPVGSVERARELRAAARLPRVK